jgi:hypothetical protein
MKMKKLFLIALMSLGMPMTSLFTPTANALWMANPWCGQVPDGCTGGGGGGISGGFLDSDENGLEPAERYEKRLERDDTIRHNKAKKACQSRPNLTERQKCLANIE